MAQASRQRVRARSCSIRSAIRISIIRWKSITALVHGLPLSIPAKRNLRGYIISAVAGYDAPLKPRALAQRQDNHYFASLPADYRARLRAEMLSTTIEDLRARGTALEGLKEHEVVCIFGGKEQIEASDLDLKITTLY